MAMEGHRPLVCEVQALVAHSHLANPRRVASGLDGQRLSLLVAVLERRAGVRLAESDVYASSVGGLRLVEPAVDLALCLAVASARPTAGWRPGSSPSARSAWPASCGSSPRPSAGWPRPRAWGSAVPSYRMRMMGPITASRCSGPATCAPRSAMALEDGGPARP
jgi:hypothetical protein